MPAPPPRDVEATGTDAPPPVPLPQEPARNAPARPRPAPAPVPPRESRPDPAKPEPPKPEAPPAAEPARPADEPSRALATLQTKPPGAESDAEGAIRATLRHANTDLSRVDYQKLNADARTQYDYAKRFIRQAEDALNAKNPVFAKTVADKAAALAAQLAGR